MINNQLINNSNAIYNILKIFSEIFFGFLISCHQIHCAMNFNILLSPLYTLIYYIYTITKKTVRQTICPTENYFFFFLTIFNLKNSSLSFSAKISSVSLMDFSYFGICILSNALARFWVFLISLPNLYTAFSISANS